MSFWKKRGSGVVVPTTRISTRGWLTCNIIAAYRPGTLATILKQIDGYFDLVRVVNGDPGSKRMSRLLKRFDVKVFDNKWREDTAKFFQPLLSDADPGEWFFWLCDDELPDVSLLEHLPQIVDDCEYGGFTSVMVPFFVVQDYIPQNTIPEFIGQARAEDVSGFDSKFRCERLVKIYDGLEMTGPTHMGWAEPNELKRTITEYPILHLKEDDGFLIGNLWPSVIDPRGHGIDADEGRELQNACKRSGIIGDERIILEKLRVGDIHDDLKEWMWRHKNETDKASWSWFAIYYFKYHPEELPDDFNYLTDKAFREWVRLMGGHEGDARFIERTRLHPLFKRNLLLLGFENVATFLNLERNPNVPLEVMVSQWLNDLNSWRRINGELYKDVAG